MQADCSEFGGADENEQQIRYREKKIIPRPNRAEIKRGCLFEQSRGVRGVRGITKGERTVRRREIYAFSRRRQVIIPPWFAFLSQPLSFATERKPRKN